MNTLANFWLSHEEFLVETRRLISQKGSRSMYFVQPVIYVTPDK